VAVVDVVPSAIVLKPPVHLHPVLRPAAVVGLATIPVRKAPGFSINPLPAPTPTNTTAAREAEKPREGVHFAFSPENQASVIGYAPYMRKLLHIKYRGQMPPPLQSSA
jgi:hypothetical protein